MKRLIVAEKPSLARFVMSCIHENFKPGKYYSDKYSYYESEHYFISYAFGHLFEAYSMEDYDPLLAEWRLDYLPFFPPENKFYFHIKKTRDPKTRELRTDPAYKSQFDTINYLVNHPQTESLIHCGDAATEGEIIVREIFNNSNKQNKPIYRLWFNEQTEVACRNALNNMKEDSFYDDYAREGFSRLKRDWLYGINLSRYLTLKAQAPMGKPIRAGRVICAMVNEIYERDMAIERFVPEKYYALISNEETNGEKIHLRSSKTFPIDNYMDATEKCALLNNSDATVADIVTEKKVVSPGKLYSLTTLQNRLASDYQLSLTDSMKLIQSVYEKGFITYPRTSAEYLGTGEKDNVKKLIELFGKQGYELRFKEGKTIFDDSKIEDHSALIPTYKIPSATDLSQEERLIYETVRNRFLAVFCDEDYAVNKSTLKILCGEEVFQIHGNITLTEGFTKYDNKKTKESSLPSLKIGDKVNVSFMPQEEQTKPLPHYTVETFNNFLEAPFSKETDTDDEIYESIKKGLQIGTVASRVPIIKNMMDCGYVRQEKQSYLIQPLGKYLIESMQLLGISMTKERTVEGSMILKQVKNNIISEEESLRLANEDIKDLLSNRNIEIHPCPFSDNTAVKEPIGKCPICDGNVYEFNNFFACENHTKEKTDDGCPLIFWKNDRFINKLSGKGLTSSNIAGLLRTGKLFVKTKDKDGNPNEALIKYKIGENQIQWEFDYDIGKCPICKTGKVKITPFGYICEKNNKENKQCYFVLFKNDKFIQAYTKKMLAPSQVASLLSKGFITASVNKKDSTEKYSLKFKLNVNAAEHHVSWEKEYVQKKK